MSQIGVSQHFNNFETGYKDLHKNDVAAVDVGASVVAVDVPAAVDVAAVSCVNIVWFSSNAVCD